MTWAFDKMWKKIIWSSATLGGSFLLWTNSDIIVHLQSSSINKKPFENEAFHIPENPGTTFYEGAKSSCLPSTKYTTTKYWNLLVMSKSRKQCNRHRAIKSLAELTNLDDWQYMMIAQTCDSRTAIGLARSPGINMSFFLSSPFKDLRKANLKEEYSKLLLSLPLSEADKCVQHLTKRAYSLAQELIKEQKSWDCELEDCYKLFHSERKKKDEFTFDKISLQAVLGLSTMKSHRLIMLEKGVLKFLHGILKHHENDTEFQSVIAQILANLALENESIKALHITGWIGILALWAKSPYVEVSLPAAKTLANLDLDDFHHSYYDNGVYLLHPYFRQNSKKERCADIIFVHGLLGATFWTWRQHDSMRKCTNSNVKTININTSEPAALLDYIGSQSYTFCWPKDWLAVDFPDARIISVDYNTCISKWVAECPQQEVKDSLDAKSRILITKLLLSNIGEKPIIWVGHSMGGLLIKQILIQAAASNNKKVNSIAQKTTGVIFCSVPHKGSSLVNIFHSVPYIFQPSIDMDQLQKGSSKLYSLHESFKEIVHQNNIAVLSFGETKKSKWGLTSSVLVSEDSSDPGLGEFYALPVDHLSTCKPESPESVAYTKITEFLHANIPRPLFLNQRFSKLDFEISNILCLIS